MRKKCQAQVANDVITSMAKTDNLDGENGPSPTKYHLRALTSGADVQYSAIVNQFSLRCFEVIEALGLKAAAHTQGAGPPGDTQPVTATLPGKGSLFL